MTFYAVDQFLAPGRVVKTDHGRQELLFSLTLLVENSINNTPQWAQVIFAYGGFNGARSKETGPQKFDPMDPGLQKPRTFLFRLLQYIQDMVPIHDATSAAESMALPNLLYSILAEKMTLAETRAKEIDAASPRRSQVDALQQSVSAGI
jgi:hypothetical protein